MTWNETITTQSRVPSLRKVGWIAGIAIATLIPNALVSQLIGEREDRATSVSTEIAAAWGPEQRIKGPTLILQVTNKDGVMHYLTLAPRSLDVRADVTPTSRKRGLFATTVYETTVAMSGSFELPDGFREGGLDSLKPGSALIAIGLGGVQGVRDDDHLEIRDNKSPWQTCSEAITENDACQKDPNILVADTDLGKTTGRSLPFNMLLHLRGTGSLHVTTAAKHVTTHIAGAWPNPSFVGTDLPVSSSSTARGFAAEWNINKVGNPPYRQAITLPSVIGAGSTVGVDMIESVPLYRTVMRISKYGLLIVILAFAAYFLFEIATGAQVSLLQYAMLGASLSLFTLLLLSFSEIVGYEVAYVVCAVLVTAQASFYTMSVTRKARASAAFAAMLATVFGFFYVLVELESYALVVGAVALFVVLSIIMAVTEKVSVGRTVSTPQQHEAVFGTDQ